MAASQTTSASADHYPELFHQPLDPSLSSALFRTPTAPNAATPTTFTAPAAAQPVHPQDPAAKPIQKRTRASRRAPTTTFNTDKANFRAMVQQFTGIPTAPFINQSLNASNSTVTPSHDLAAGPHNVWPQQCILGQPQPMMFGHSNVSANDAQFNYYEVAGNSFVFDGMMGNQMPRPTSSINVRDDVIFRSS